MTSVFVNSRDRAVDALRHSHAPAEVVRYTEEALTAARRVGAHVIDVVQLGLAMARMSLDPESRATLENGRRQLEDVDAFRERVRAHRRPPDEVAKEYEENYVGPVH